MNAAGCLQWLWCVKMSGVPANITKMTRLLLLVKKRVSAALTMLFLLSCYVFLIVFRVFMPIITQKYVSSRYCVNELYAADNDKKVIFPVIFSDADFTVSDTAKGVKFVVSSINWTMCRPAIDDYRQSLDKLISAIKGKG